METPLNNKLLGGLFLIVACGIGLYIGQALLPTREDKLAKSKIRKLEIHIDSLRSSIRLKDSAIANLQKQDGVKVVHQKKLEKKIDSLHRQLRVKLTIIDSLPSSELREKMIKAYENHN